MAAIASTIIDGYAVVVEPNPDREGVNCFIQRGRYGSSLAHAEFEGCLLCDHDDSEEAIDEAIVDRIRVFAEQHGY